MNHKTITKKDGRIRVFCLILFFLTACMMAYLQPTHNILPLFPNPPDEHARILIPQFIARNGRLPTGFEEEVQIPGYGSSYAFQPGLPYLLMGLVMRFAMRAGAAGFALTFSARMVNVFSGTLCMALLFLIGARLFQRESAARFFAVACAFHPQHLFVCTYVNTDAMCLLSIALMGYALVRMYQDGATIQSAVLLAAGQILCALTYYNAYGFLLCSVLICVLYFVHRDASGRFFVDRNKMKRYALLTGVLLLAGAGWWFVRNLVMLDGDLFGLSTTFRLQSEHGVIKIPPLAQGIGVLRMLAECHDTMFISFVAVYGSMSLVAGWKYYLLYRLFLSTGLICGCIFYLKERRTLSLHVRWFVRLLLVAMAITTLLWVYYCYAIDYQPQGRYLMPVVIPLYVCICKGYEGICARLSARWRKPSFADAGMTALTCISVLTSLYYIFGTAVPVYLSVRG